MKKIHFKQTIHAPVERVWHTMLAPDSYREWTSVFCEGSYFEGSWDQGASIRFLTPQGDGMVSTIVENRPHEFISIQHLGMVNGGVEDRSSDEVKSWAGAFENYSFKPVDGGTELSVDQDITDDHEQMMSDIWPQALHKLKVLAEAAA